MQIEAQQHSSEESHKAQLRAEADSRELQNGLSDLLVSN